MTQSTDTLTNVTLNGTGTVHKAHPDKVATVLPWGDTLAACGSALNGEVTTFTDAEVPTCYHRCRTCFPRTDNDW